MRFPSNGSLKTTPTGALDSASNIKTALTGESLTTRDDCKDLNSFVANIIVDSPTFGNNKRSVLSSRQRDKSPLNYTHGGALKILDQRISLQQSSHNVTNMSAANFSSMEKQQQTALLGITGNTLSQYMAD
jgi:hypothetical protein